MGYHDPTEFSVYSLKKEAILFERITMQQHKQYSNVYQVSTFMSKIGKLQIISSGTSAVSQLIPLILQSMFGLLFSSLL